jgi:multidrug efflux system membrane fusion protein
MYKNADFCSNDRIARQILSAKYVNPFIVLLCLLFLVSCSKKPAGQSPAVPVLTARVEQKTIPLEIKNFGTVEAYSTTAVKSQVAGILTGVHFTQGQMVKKNELLISIDPRPFEAALKSAEANLSRDEAQLKYDEKALSRYTELLKKGSATQEQYDQVSTTAEALRATVKADNAAVENAKLQLDYCSIRSPIDGITGELLVDQGNLVKEKDITIVIINQIKPIYVTFSVPQQYLLQIQKYMADDKLEAIARPPQAPEQGVVGWLSFVDNSVDNNTGTVRLRATFDNNDMQLWPGQYVNVNLILTQEPNAIVIPSQAVQTSQNGQFVFIVKSDQTVEQRPVTIERRTNNETVVKGLEAGEIVVTDGQLNLVPGAKVQIKNPAQK